MIALLQPHPWYQMYQNIAHVKFPSEIKPVRMIIIIPEHPTPLEGFSISQLPTSVSLILQATTSMSKACINKKPMDTILANSMYPSKNVFGIHIVEMKNANTMRNLIPQQPSWNRAAPVFLTRIIQSTKAWKQARTKLILIMALGPMQAAPSPDQVGQERASGRISTSLRAVKRRMIEIINQKNWKKT